jgi:hypothetical protein
LFELICVYLRHQREFFCFPQIPLIFADEAEMFRGLIFLFCNLSGRPACICSSLYGFYAFLRCRITKKCRRNGKQAAEIAKDVAESIKRLQKLQKTQQDGNRPSRAMSFPGI